MFDLYIQNTAFPFLKVSYSWQTTGVYKDHDSVLSFIK